VKVKTAQIDVNALYQQFAGDCRRSSDNESKVLVSRYCRFPSRFQDSNHSVATVFPADTNRTYTSLAISQKHQVKSANRNEESRLTTDKGIEVSPGRIRGGSGRPAHSGFRYIARRRGQVLTISNVVT
jgi:hypothetical protein